MRFLYGGCMILVISSLFPSILSQIAMKTSLTIKKIANVPDLNLSDPSSSYVPFEVDSSDFDQVDDTEDDVQIMYEGTTMTFVFDVTFSMFDDLQAVIAGAERILTSTLERRDSPIRNFALVPFHDPGLSSDCCISFVFIQVIHFLFSSLCFLVWLYILSHSKRYIIFLCSFPLHISAFISLVLGFLFSFFLFLSFSFSLLHFSFQYIFTFHFISVSLK